MWQEAVTAGPQSMSCKRPKVSWDVSGNVYVYWGREGRDKVEGEGQFYLKKARHI